MILEQFVGQSDSFFSGLAKVIASLTSVPLLAFGGASGFGDQPTELSLSLPFDEASTWQEWQGDQDLSLVYEVDGQSKRFGVAEREFLFQPGDTWFVYGLFGPTELNRKPYGARLAQWQGRHNGIDFVTAPGMTVRAAQEGQVIFVDQLLGTSVIVEHAGGFQTTYGYLADVAVRQGQKIKRGQPLGRVSRLDGNVAGDVAGRLHFELDELESDGTVWAVNPLGYLDLGQALVPQAEANSYYQKPWAAKAQVDFVWPREQFLSL